MDGTIKKSWVQEIHPNGTFTSKKKIEKIGEVTTEESVGVWECESPIFFLTTEENGLKQYFHSLILAVDQHQFTYVVMDLYSFDNVFTATRLPE